MKKLIALLLFPCMAWGQILTKQLDPVDTLWEEVILEYKDDQVEEDNLWPEDCYDVDTAIAFYWRSKQEVEILHLLELYEQDCYNDSTYVHELRQEWVEDYRMSDEVSAGHYEYYEYKGYERKEPTFIGFIKWLKARK